jgi:hypothetical protein
MLTVEVRGTRVYRSNDDFLDHFMALNKTKLLTRRFHPRRKQENETRKQSFKVNLLQQDSIRSSECHHLNQYLHLRSTSLDINKKWQISKLL